MHHTVVVKGNYFSYTLEMNKEKKRHKLFSFIRQKYIINEAFKMLLVGLHAYNNSKETVTVTIMFKAGLISSSQSSFVDGEDD